MPLIIKPWQANLPASDFRMGETVHLRLFRIDQGTPKDCVAVVAVHPLGEPIPNGYLCAITIKGELRRYSGIEPRLGFTLTKDGKLPILR